MMSKFRSAFALFLSLTTGRCTFYHRYSCAYLLLLTTAPVVCILSYGAWCPPPHLLVLLHTRTLSCLKRDGEQRRRVWSDGVFSRFVLLSYACVCVPSEGQSFWSGFEIFLVFMYAVLPENKMVSPVSVPPTFFSVCASVRCNSTAMSAWAKTIARSSLLKGFKFEKWRLFYLSREVEMRMRVGVRVLDYPMVITRLLV